MQKISACVFTFLACLGSGLKLHSSDGQEFLSTRDALKTLTTLLYALHPCSAGVRSAASQNRMSPMMMARKPVVGGNWKCNPAAKADLDDLIKNINDCDTSDCDLYVSPSPLHVDYVSGKITNGAMVTPQNCNFKGCGAFTGEMAVEQMKDMGLTNVLIGHSERRGEFGIFPMDTDDTLATKLKYILDAGMSCVYCIGEPLSIREKGLDAVLAEMDKQMTQIYSLLDPAKVVIAYEPVWAIGTGVTATPEDAQATQAGIRKLIAEKASPEVAENIRIQYGGSANAANAADLSAQPDIDGFLVGGASLKPEFKEIVAAIAAAKKA
jgi:triosephosphate isomerase